MRLYKAPDTEKLDAEIQGLESQIQALYEKLHEAKDERTGLLEEAFGSLPDVTLRRTYASPVEAKAVRWTKATIWVARYPEDEAKAARYRRSDGQKIGGSRIYRSFIANIGDLNATLDRIEADSKA